ncbi:MAG TPA: amidase, partial [Acidimicrobiales bacterium]|nr:amidase [Acidimicrobiales bacterium]
MARIDEVDGSVNAIIWRNDDEARAAARLAAAQVVQSKAEGLPPFHGVPLPIKDVTPVAGWPVTYGSWGAPGAPAAESALVVGSFRRAGFVLTARTNVPEMGLISVAENDRYGLTRNPWDLARTAGGSTGGAAAVAAGMFSIAHGNDGGGSIRIPAACCGLVGLKVSRGRVPGHFFPWEGGVVEGVVTRDVASTAAVLDATCGPDRDQWYNAPPPERPFLSEAGANPGRLRIALVDEAPFGLPTDPECIEAVAVAARALERLGHYLEPARLEVPEEFVTAFLAV